MSSYEVYVGVDIAATSATVTWQRGGQRITKPQTIAQTPAGFASLQRSLIATGVPPQQTLLVMEATGSYWVSLATFFVRQGYVVSVINALQAHHFAKALFKRAKTDAIDAQTLTQLPSCSRRSRGPHRRRSTKNCTSGWHNGMPCSSCAIK